MNRKIKKVAVLGSGIMGSRIACHFANIGLNVLLLDISPKDLTEEEVKKNLCGTHFFNPPRYLRLLEIIPGVETENEVITFLMQYGDLFLGKSTVECKDTPAFIANRVGVFSIMSLLHLVEKGGYTIDEI